MERDEVGAPEQLVERGLLDTFGLVDLREGVVDEDGGAEAAQDTGHVAADGAVADEPDGGGFELETGGLPGVVAFPLAAADGGVGLGNAAQGGEHHGDSVLSCRGGVTRGGVGHGYAVLGRGRDVDVDRAAAADDEELEVGGVLHDALGKRGVVGDADGDTLEGVDHLLFGAGGFADFRDVAEGLEREWGGGFDDLEAVGCFTQLGAHEAGEDEVVADDEKFWLWHGGGPRGFFVGLERDAGRKAVSSLLGHNPIAQDDTLKGHDRPGAGKRSWGNGA